MTEPIIGSNTPTDWPQGPQLALVSLTVLESFQIRTPIRGFRRFTIPDLLVVSPRTPLQAWTPAVLMLSLQRFNLAVTVLFAPLCLPITRLQIVNKCSVSQRYSVLGHYHYWLVEPKETSLNQNLVHKCQVVEA